MQLFTFDQKQCFYLTDSVPGCFEKLPVENKQETQFKRLYLKKQSEFRVTFKIIFKFIQISSK